MLCTSSSNSHPAKERPTDNTGGGGRFTRLTVSSTRSVQDFSKFTQSKPFGPQPALRVHGHQRAPRARSVLLTAALLRGAGRKPELRRATEQQLLPCPGHPERRRAEALRGHETRAERCATPTQSASPTNRLLLLYPRYGQYCYAAKHHGAGQSLRTLPEKGIPAFCCF